MTPWLASGSHRGYRLSSIDARTGGVRQLGTTGGIGVAEAASISGAPRVRMCRLISGPATATVRATLLAAGVDLPDELGVLALVPTYEEHFLPGEGIVDFRHVFTTLHQRGYRGPFTLGFGRPEVKVEWRDRWAALLDEIAAS